MAMLPSEISVARTALRSFCDGWNKSNGSSERRVVFNISGTTAHLVEQRPHGTTPGAWSGRNVAKFTFRKTGNWELSYPKPDGGWQPFEGRPASPVFGELLMEVERDAMGVFWGSRSDQERGSEER
jgi:hypothetical protein